MRCVAYVRTANRKNKDASLLIQTEMIKAYIAQNNWQLDSIYTDIGSGIGMNKNLLKMIEDAQQEKIDVIIASDPSRISRKYSDLSNILGKLCESNKVHIITVDNQINTILNDNDNIIMLNHHAYVHEHEARQ
ncbi:recombinase family protein [Priestia flexa]|uniref:recombinase family protein n=1 Tax=Priestia flexa TaxID=86664 RepID=UPI000C24E5DF|nr:recombinase family protein [Priestia flexa]MEC0664826.1 recombinase family protein [Priestia flexa]